MSKKEATARLKINKLLESSGWQLFDTDNSRATVQVESHVKLEQLGNDFEHVPSGFIDYLLVDSNNHPLAVLEAKRESINPLSAKEQARKYANEVHARYIILSNGNCIFYGIPLRVIPNLFGGSLRHKHYKKLAAINQIRKL